jgi:ABC-type Fe3+/spermidine/putrescine transport system ATPase subunit
MSIQLDKLTKRYGKQSVVNQVSLEIEPGELFVLLGASGSGKSTILRMIAGLTPLDEGKIWLHGRDVTHLPPQKRDTGFVFQNYSLFQQMNVAQNIAFALNVRRVSRREKNTRVTELLELIGLAELEKRMPWQLSGGQQQRVALARALAHEPGVLLLDEPFGALDVKIRAQLRQNLREIQQRLNVTTILVTHDQEEAFELADRIGIIEQGRLLEVGTPSQLYRRPQTHFTATFLGTANLLPAQRNSHYVHLGDARLPVPPDSDHLENQAVQLLARPEEIELTTDPAALNGSLIGQGMVMSLTFAGSQERVTVQLGETSLDVLLQPDRVRALGLVPGQTVCIGIKDYHLLSVN